MTADFARWSASLVSAAALVLAAAGGAAASPDCTAGMKPIAGHTYLNAEYGFRFTAPARLTVLRAAAPAPNHGALIPLGPGRRIEVSAAFDAPGYGSTGALLNARLPPDATGPVQHQATHLGGRTAEAATYRQGTEVHMIVVRHRGAADTGINYTADLTSTVASAGADRAVFDRVLASVRFISRK